MLNRGTIWMLTLITMVQGAIAGTVQGAPLIQLSQDGRHYSILHLISGHETVQAYYRYAKGLAHPSYGTMPGLATAGFYWDMDNGRLSLLVTVGGTQGSGSVRVSIQSMPASARLLFAEKGGQVSLPQGLGKLAATLVYKNGSAGFIVDLPGASSSKPVITLQPIAGLTTVQVADGDPAAGGVERLLDLSKPLLLKVFAGGGRHGENSLLQDPFTELRPYQPTVSAASGTRTPVTTSPVPDPGLASAWVMITSMLAVRPRRRLLLV